ncbi:MAG: hypothetical protein WC410_02570 [Candidatus Paceibacterota bacterium]|jgi:hypothetical protein
MAINITRPTVKIVKDYLKKWDNLENYVLQENALNLLFKETYPKNIKLENILIKVCCLNQFYSTNIYSPFIVAKHILKLNIDNNLATGDLDVVNKIAKIEMSKGKTRNFYSFASKYCSHHWPERYPIYDSFVDKMLMHFQKQDKFYKFKKEDLHDYKKFSNILQQFKEFYKIYNYSIKDIDRYLWQAGKEYFPKY